MFKDELLIRKERRNYRKRRHKTSVTRGGLTPSGVSSTGASIPLTSSARGMGCFSDVPSASSEDEIESAVVASHSDVDEAESDVEKQGPFAFRRKLHCNYLAVSFHLCKIAFQDKFRTILTRTLMHPHRL